MLYTFCFIEKTTERGARDKRHNGAEWAVITREDPEFWLASFPTEEKAIEYAREINTLADQWRKAWRSW